MDSPAAARKYRPIQNEMASRLMPQMPVYAFFVVQKVSSKLRSQERFVGVCQPYLFMLTDEGSITRMMLLTELAGLQWDRDSSKVLLKATPDSLERDWLFDYVEGDARSTTRDCAEAVDIIRECREQYVPGPLPVDSKIELPAQLVAPAGGMSPKDRVAHLREHPELIPRRLTASQVHQHGAEVPAAGDRNMVGAVGGGEDAPLPPGWLPVSDLVPTPSGAVKRSFLQLARPGGNLGLHCCFLTGHDGQRCGVVRGLDGDSPAANAGVPRGSTLQSIAGVHISDEESFGMVVQRMRDTGCVQVMVETRGGEWDEDELPPPSRSHDSDSEPLPPPSSQSASGYSYSYSYTDPAPQSGMIPLPPRNTLCQWFCDQFDALDGWRRQQHWQHGGKPNPRQVLHEHRLHRIHRAAPPVDAPSRIEVTELRVNARREFEQLLQDPAALERTQSVAQNLVAAGCPEIVYGAMMDGAGPGALPPMSWVVDNLPSAIRAYSYGGPEHLKRVAAQHVAIEAAKRKQRRNYGSLRL